MLVTWAPRGRAKLGAIRAKQGQPLDSEYFRSLLRRRLQELVDEAEDEDLAQALDLLREAGLLFSYPDRTEAAEMIAYSPEVVMALSEKGIPGVMPPRMDKNNPTAEEAFDETSLLQWVLALRFRGRAARGASRPVGFDINEAPAGVAVRPDDGLRCLAVGDILKPLAERLRAGRCGGLAVDQRDGRETVGELRTSDGAGHLSLH